MKRFCSWIFRSRGVASRLALVFGSSVVGLVGAQAASTAAVGAFAFRAGPGVTSLADSPQHVGDLLVLFAKADGSGFTVSSVSGGGVGTWTRAISYSRYTNHDLELWIGTVATVGASTITPEPSSPRHRRRLRSPGQLSARRRSLWRTVPQLRRRLACRIATRTPLLGHRHRRSRSLQACCQLDCP